MTSDINCSLVVPGLKRKKDGSYSISIECPCGNIDVSVLKEVTKLAEEFGVTVHLTSVQKIMLLDLTRETGEKALARLKSAGATVKTKRTLSQAMVCVGLPYCPLALQETIPLANYLYKEVSSLEIPPKMKTAISGCPAACSWANMVDVGFVGVKNGFKVLVGGHGGYRPVVGKEMGLIKNHKEAVDVVKKARALFVEHTEKKGRLSDVVEKLGVERFKKELGFV